MITSHRAGKRACGYSKPKNCISAASATLPIIVTAALLTACQTNKSETGNSTAALESAAQQEARQGEALPGAVEETTGAETQPQTTALVEETAQQPVQQASIAAAPAGQCAIPLAGGPPAKPPRGKDFGKAVVKNTGKRLQSGALRILGGAIGGQAGAIAGDVVAGTTIKAEQDVKGVWMLTDGSPNCACEVSIDSAFKLAGKGTDQGFSKLRGCTNPQIAQITNWHLGYSFIGYDSKFQFKAKDKKTVLATLNRDGIHYFSGTLADGTPVVLWRQGQNHLQLTKFNQSLKK